MPKIVFTTSKLTQRPTHTNDYRKKKFTLNIFNLGTYLSVSSSRLVWTTFEQIISLLVIHIFIFYSFYFSGSCSSHVVRVQKSPRRMRVNFLIFKNIHLDINAKLVRPLDSFEIIRSDIYTFSSLQSLLKPFQACRAFSSNKL